MSFRLTVFRIDRNTCPENTPILQPGGVCSDLDMMDDRCRVSDAPSIAEAAREPNEVPSGTPHWHRVREAVRAVVVIVPWNRQMAVVLIKKGFNWSI